MAAFRFNKCRSLRNQRGISVLGIVIAIAIVGVMGSGMVVMVATNQETRNQVLYQNQSFYSNQAGIEFALGQILEDGNTDSSITRDFMGESISITRSSGVIQITTSEGIANSAYEIEDVNPSDEADCLVVDTSAAALNGGNRILQGITLARDASCSDTITIDRMTVSWVPNDLGRQMNRIQIAGGTVYTSGGVTSGTNVNITDYNIADYATHNLTGIRWSGTVDNRNFTISFQMSDGSLKTVTVNFLAADQANCFQLNASSVYLNRSSGVWRDVQGVTVQNTCSDPIRLDRVTVSWTPTTPSRNMTQLRIDGSNVLNGSYSSGSNQNVDDIYAALTSYNINRIRFNSEVVGKDYSITWQFADGTTKVTDIDVFASNQDTCVTLDKSMVSIGGGGNRDLLGLELVSSCTEDVGVVAVTVSWTGDTSKRLTQVRFDGITNYSGSRQSGQQADFGTQDAYFRNEDVTQNIDRLRFNSAVNTGTDYDIEFEFSDGTTLSDTVNIASQANSLSVDTSSSSIGGSGDVDVLGITISNTGSTTITVDRMIVTWASSSGRRIRRVRIDSSNVWNGNSNSGTNLNITNVSLTASQTKNIDYLRYNGDMSGRTFTIEFIMLDGSSLTTSSFSPPG